MKRVDIIQNVGTEFLKSNVENDEFSYPKEYKLKNLKFDAIKRPNNKKFEMIDLRFVSNRISVLIETKTDFEKDPTSEQQLSAYVEYEKGLTGNKVIAILANTKNNKIKVWRGAVAEENLLTNETALKTFDEYAELYTTKVNNKEKVMQNTYNLNNLLHKHGISEKLRSQFVGTCLLALKNGLQYQGVGLTSNQISSGIKDILGELLKVDMAGRSKDIHKAGKLALLESNVLLSQDIRSLKAEDFREILNNINENILPFINDKSTAGQDLLNLFFITFNKYVGKDDKNQAFTPDHITEFMSMITGVNKNSRVLDPCCGSGSFLVRAMTQALDDCANAKEQSAVREEKIFGIEYDENIYGLATTNMLIHGDGNSNIVNGSCFDFTDWIVEAKPNIILMNPPYNAQKKHMPEMYTEHWSKKQKEDPSKGLYFVKHIADLLNKNGIQAKIAVLLPVACAIGNSKIIKDTKTELLKENTLDAVFTLPNEIFYPGAAASACCMIFNVGTRHKDSGKTFFGYFKDDGFKKKKNLGRVEQLNSKTGRSSWVEKLELWTELYKDRITQDGISVTHQVNGDDEWLCEAYMKTDYSTVSDKDFQETINHYLAYLVKSGMLYEDNKSK